MSQTKYRVTKKILSGTFAGSIRSEITTVAFDIGFKSEDWTYGPAYLVIDCQPYDEGKELLEGLIRAARILAITASKFERTYKNQNLDQIDAESPFNEDSMMMIDAAKRLIEREEQLWKHLDGR